MTNTTPFNTTFATSNPFTNSTTSPSLDESLAASYARLEALKKQYESQQNPKVQTRSVFSDISDELSGLSEDEANFVLSSKEYQAVNQKYQNEFSQFLINKFSAEYAQAGNTRTLEEMLATIKRQKEKYKDKFASDINEIRDQNKTLIETNNKLAENNAALQKQLEEIKNRIWKDE